MTCDLGHWLCHYTVIYGFAIVSTVACYGDVRDIRKLHVSVFSAETDQMQIKYTG